MELGMIGLGRMGTNMVRRLQRAGHQRVVYDLHPEYGIMAAYAEGLNIPRHANAGKRRRTDLAKFAGRVADSGEGLWTIAAAIDESVPAPVLSAGLYERFSSRGEDDFADKVLSALHYEYGGHEAKAVTRNGGES